MLKNLSLMAPTQLKNKNPNKVELEVKFCSPKHSHLAVCITNSKTSMFLQQISA